MIAIRANGRTTGEWGTRPPQQNRFCISSKFVFRLSLGRGEVLWRDSSIFKLEVRKN